MRRPPLAAVFLPFLAVVSCGRGSRTDSAGETIEAAQHGPLGPLGNPTGIRVVDFHTHFDPSEVDLVLGKLDQAGIATAINVQGGMPRALRTSVATQEKSGGRLRFFCTIPWGAVGIPDFVGELVRFMGECKAKGGLGLKISKALGLGVPDPLTEQLLAVDDPWLDPIFEAAGRLGLPVLIHVGDPKAFFLPKTPDNERYEELMLAPDWDFSDRTTYPSWEDLFGAFVRRVARHPGTTFVGAHFGNDPEEPLRVGQLMREHPNLWIDTAARIPEIGRRPPEEVRSVFAEFPDRIVFGSDVQIAEEGYVLGAGPPETTEADVETFWRSTWRYFETTDGGIPSPTPIQGRWTVTGIGLPRESLEKLYHGNAERLLGL